MRIALDPGHLGGRWAQLEERWFQIGSSPPVMEGEMTLRVARLLADRLRVLGAAEAVLVRDSDEPTTPLRPADLAAASRALLAEEHIDHPRDSFSGPADPQRTFSLPWTSNVLFTRADIRARGKRVNGTIKPDLVLCLHFNAEGWGDPAKPALVEKNHVHVLVNGSYGPDEIPKDDVRFEMLLKLLNGSAPEELGVAEAVPRRWRRPPACRRFSTRAPTRTIPATARTSGRAISWPTASTNARWSISNLT